MTKALIVTLATALFACACSPSGVSPTAKTPAPAQTPPALEVEQALAKIAADWTDCLNSHGGDAIPLIVCDGAAVDAANALTPHSDQTRFKAFLDDMATPLELAATGGERALSQQVGVAYAYAGFAQDRATVLLGPPNSAPTEGLGGTLNLDVGAALRKLDSAGSLDRRWRAIRAADCIAYPVVNCVARLDAALGKVLDSYLESPPAG